MSDAPEHCTMEIDAPVIVSSQNKSKNGLPIGLHGNLEVSNWKQCDLQVVIDTQYHGHVIRLDDLIARNSKSAVFTATYLAPSNQLTRELARPIPGNGFLVVKVESRFSNDRAYRKLLRKYYDNERG
eukprot:41203_1